MADNRNFEGELTKAISGSLIIGRIVVMAVAIAIASVGVYAFGAIDDAVELGQKSQWLFWLKYLISGIGWVIGAYFVLSGMAAVCKMSAARDSGQSRNIFSGIMDIFGNLFVVFFATLRYLFWFVALLIVIWGLGFIGRIPGFGPIVYGIALGAVSVAAALWIALHVAKFFGAALVLPGIIATTAQKGISCLKESKRIINGQPVRLVKRFLTVGLVLVLFAYVIAQGIAFLAGNGVNNPGHGGAALGKSYEVLVGGPPLKYLPLAPGYPVLPVNQTLRMVSGVQVGQASKARLAGAWIFSIELIVVLLILKAVALNFFALAGMSTYQALKDAPAASITAPDIKVPDFGKMKGSLGAVGAKFREEMREGGEETKAPPKKEG